MQVDKIEIGTVIDHIKSGKAAKVMVLLGIDVVYPHRVAVMLHVPSKTMGKKDILKIEGKLVSAEECNAIALISPGASINIIQGGKVQKKYSVNLPAEVSGPVRCPNPSCVGLEYISRFRRESGVNYRCHYCERLFGAEELI